MKSKLSVRISILFLVSFVIVLSVQAFQGIKGYINNFLIIDANQNLLWNIQEATLTSNELMVEKRSVYDDAFKDFIDESVQYNDRFRQKFYMLNLDFDVIYESDLYGNYINLIMTESNGQEKEYFINLGTIDETINHDIVDALRESSKASVDISGTITTQPYYYKDKDKVRDVYGTYAGDVTRRGDMILRDGTLVNSNRTVEFINPTYLKINNKLILDGDKSNLIEGLMLATYLDDEYTYAFSYYRRVQYQLINQQEDFDDALEEIIGRNNFQLEMEKFRNSIRFTPMEINNKYYFAAILPLYDEPMGINADNENSRKGYMVALLYYPNIQKEMTIQYLEDNSFAYVVALLLAGLLTWICTKIIVNPIKKIESNAKKIANHDFSEKLKIKDTTEIGALANSINEMSSKLESTMSNLENEIEQVRLLETTRKEFVANFTHEMKTPIAVINGYSELMEDTSDEDKRKQYLMIIDEETQKINKLVKSMLELSKLELHKVELKLKDVDVESLLIKTIEPFECLLEDKQASIVMEIEDTLIRCDEEQIQSVFTNMISNAIQHVNDHGKIYIKMNQEQFSIENEGQQIPSEKLNSLWNAFESGHTKGTGLGLAICKNILDLHGFSYKVDNTSRGVIFTIYFT
ncbi:sensor histidine kinase [Anaerorhabdus sp.]